MCARVYLRASPRTTRYIRDSARHDGTIAPEVEGIYRWLKGEKKIIESPKERESG